MLKNHPLMVVLFLFLAAGLTSCNSLPTCDPNNLPLPSVLSPTWGEAFSIGSDVLTWEFPYTTCEPEGYIVELSDEPAFVNTSLNATLTMPDTIYNPGSALQPATKYYWQVSAYVGGVVGPPSIQYVFYTEPVCSHASLVAPELMSPTDGSTITTLNPLFDWDYPDPSCFPDGFHFRVSEDPGMGTFVMESNTPSTWSDEFIFGVPLDDCKTYYYQVTPYVNGTAGPASEIYKFVTNTTGVCACNPINLPIPEPLLPSPYSAGDPVIVPVDMQVVWANPGPCTPDGYRIELDSDFEYADSPYNGAVSDGGTTEYTPPTLEPATQYWWHAFSTYQGTESASSTYATFFTEPECSSFSQLTAPVILDPQHGAFVNTLNPMFNFVPGLPGCIPDTFQIELNTDPNFQGQSLELQPFLTTVAGFSDPLNDCTNYYLRVAAIQDGSLGPYSLVHRFYVNAQGTCFPSPIGKANQNVFCKIGPDWDYGVHLFEKDDWIRAVAKNPDASYLEVHVPDDTGEKPKDPPVTCWIPFNAFTSEDDFDPAEMFVNYPPILPETEDGGGRSGTPACHSSLPAEDCKKAGGIYYSTPPGTCICPKP